MISDFLPLVLTGQSWRRAFTVFVCLGLVSMMPVVAGCGGGGGSSSSSNSSAVIADDDDEEDEDAMEFSNWNLLHINQNEVTVMFVTSELATCEILYGLSEDNMALSAVDPNMNDGELTLFHEVPLLDLVEGSTYFYRARAIDIRGEVYLSEIRTFKTIGESIEADGSDLYLNVALAENGTRVLAVSSSFGGAADDEQWGGNSAIDGLMSTEWSSDGDGDDAYITLDFGQVREIIRVGLRSRSMADGSAIVTSAQMIFDGAVSVGPFTMPSELLTHTFEFNETISASQVTIEVLASTGGNTGFKEIELYIED